MNLPLLSVIVPVYKVEAYLDRCVGSILAQSYRNLELILVDDGSPDGCGVLCDQWAVRDRRVRVIHQENRGAGQARNAGLASCTGALIGFVDGDDYIAPDMYLRLYRLMEQTHAGIAECGYVETEGDDAPFSQVPGERVYTAEEAMAEHIRDTAFQQTIWNKLYRRETAVDVRFPVGNLIDDEFWTYQALGNAKLLARCGDRLYAYRQSPGSAMRRPFSLRRLQGLDAKEERLAYLGRRFPALVPLARQDLLFTSLMCMQGSLRYLHGGELAQARRRIRRTVESLGKVSWDGSAGLKRNCLLWLAQRSLEGAANGLNRLEDLGILR